MTDRLPISGKYVALSLSCSVARSVRARVRTHSRKGTGVRASAMPQSGLVSIAFTTRRAFAFAADTIRDCRLYIARCALQLLLHASCPIVRAAQRHLVRG